MRRSDHFYCFILLSFHHLFCFPLSKFTPPSSPSALKVPLQVSAVGFLRCLGLTTRGKLSGSQTNKLNLQNTQHPHFFFFPCCSSHQEPEEARCWPPGSSSRSVRWSRGCEGREAFCNWLRTSAKSHGSKSRGDYAHTNASSSRGFGLHALPRPDAP